MSKIPFNFPKFEPGSVWLTGAGPGDPTLLSLLAWHGLQSSDVIVHDALVPDELLKAAPKDAKLIYAGKRGGIASPKQTDISQRIIELARQNKRVLRLKGGDPYIFGRGGEEALALVKANVPFRVIPGISAGVGGLAYAGIPLTHRETNSVVTFVTGHDAKGVTPASVNWDSIATGSPVLVLYMALRNLEDITERLQQAGRLPSEPIALISRATLPDQKVIITELGVAAATASKSKIKAPVIIVIGEVVHLRDQLNWLGFGPVNS